MQHIFVEEGACVLTWS